MFVLVTCAHLNTAGHSHILLSSPGCFVSGLYLEGADWDIDRGCLIKSKPKVLVVDLPILKIIPIEAHRLKLQVSYLPGPMVHSFPPLRAG